MSDPEFPIVPRSATAREAGGNERAAAEIMAVEMARLDLFSINHDDKSSRESREFDPTSLLPVIKPLDLDSLPAPNHDEVFANFFEDEGGFCISRVVTLPGLYDPIPKDGLLKAPACCGKSNARVMKDRMMEDNPLLDVRCPAILNCFATVMDPTNKLR